MKVVFNFFKDLFFIILIVLILDITLGKFVHKKFIKKKLQDVNLDHGKSSKIFDHDFEKNVNKIVGWGDKRVKFCTDDNGFRVSCDYKIKKNKTFDIVIIGDSMTEGVGLEYEQTYSGLISNHFISKKIANLGQTSYSTAIYYAKINHFLKNGYKFDEIVVFLDPSDIRDDALCYSLNGEVVVRRKTFQGCMDNLSDKKMKYKIFFQNNFRLINTSLGIIKKNLVNFGFLDEKISEAILNNSSSEWAFNYKKENFNNLTFNQVINISLQNMNLLYQVLNKNDIKLSLVIYPHPANLFHNKKKSNYEEIWKRFCEKKCNKYINLMPFFIKELNDNNFTSIYKKYYIKNDVHFNKQGNKFIADLFIENYKK